jgi:DNA invertase Pin-like site-specific DNA recombinase
MSGEVTELWVWEFSRASRDRPVSAALIGACMAQDVKITVNGRVHDPNDPDDAFMLDLGSALAVKESALTSRRIRRDVAARAVQGHPHGRIPYGYLREYDPHTGALVRQVPDPETASIVAELARRVLAGEALYRLAAELNERGVPSPETVRKRRMGDTESTWGWRPDQVRDVVASPTAAGLRVHQGTVLTDVTATWQPIITPSDHALLVAKFADPGRKSWTDATAKHLLTGLARCGECGGEIRRISNRGCPSYACVGRRHQHIAGTRRFCVSRRMDYVDTFVTDVVVERLAQPDLRDVFTTDTGDFVQAAQRQLAELRAEHTELIALAERREVSVTAFARLEAALLPQIADAERRARPAAVPPLIEHVAGPDAAARWEGLELEQRREVIRLLATVRIMRRPDSEKGRKGFDPNLVKVEWQQRWTAEAS